MEAASNNLSFLFPKSIVRAVERFYQWLFEHATASRNISCGGPKKDGFSGLSVLPLNETGGKLTYQVIVTNIAKGELSVALPPFHCGGLKKNKKKTPYCTCGLYRHESFPRQNEEFTAAWKNSPRGARMTRSAVLLPLLPVGFRMGQLECNDEMEKFQRSEHSHAEGNWRFCHQRTLHDMLSIPRHRETAHKV